jgi:hypothetical protein
MATLAGLPTSAYRPRSRAPAAPDHWRHEQQWHERPAVAQFIYLSLLLHAIAILLFGAPPGGSRDGRAMWSSMNVRIVAPAAPIDVPAPMPAIEPGALPKLEREFRPARPIVTPQVVVPAPMQRINPPQMKLEKMLSAPKVDFAPAPVPPPAVSPPKVEAPAPAAPIVVPAPISPIVPRLPTVERTLVEPPKIVAPIAHPVTPPVKEAPPVEVPLPRVETPLVPAIPAAPALPAMDRVPELAPKVAAPPPVAEPATPKSESPATPAPDAPMSREELFKPRAPALPAPAPATPAAPAKRADDYDPTKPSVDLDAVRRRATQLAREGTGQRALLPFPMPAPPERKTKTEEALEKARKPDCRTAYKDLGLLAAVPLIANEFGEGSCRW